MDSLTRQRQQQHTTESRLHETTNTSSRHSSSQQSSSSKHSRIMSVPQSPAYSDITVIENKKLNTNGNGNYAKSQSFHSSPPLSPPLSTQEAHRKSVIKHMVNNSSSSSTSNLNKTSNNNNNNNNTFYSNNAVYVSETDLYNVKNRLVPIPSAALLANSRYLPLFIRDRDVLRIGCHWSSQKSSSSPSSPSSSTVLPVYIHETDCLKIEHESICVYISEKDLQHVKDKFGVDFFKSTNTPQPQPYKTPTPSSWVCFVFVFDFCIYLLFSL